MLDNPMAQARGREPVIETPESQRRDRHDVTREILEERDSRVDRQKG